MISHFLNKFIKETFYFCGCWMFQNKWINESVPPSLCRGLSPTNIGKKIVSTNFWQIFKTQFWQIFILSPPIIMRGKRDQKSCSIFEYLWIYRLLEWLHQFVSHVLHPDVFWYRLSGMGAQKNATQRSSCNTFSISASCKN